MLTINLDDLIIESNVREEVGDVTSLAASIAEVGLMQPIRVAPVDVSDPDSAYILVAGARRRAALMLNGEVTTLAVLDETIMDAGQLIAAQYAENTERVSLSDWERAQAALDLKTEGFDQGEVSVSLGIPKKEVSKLQKIARLDLSYADASQLSIDALLEVAEAAKQLEDEGVLAEDIVRPLINHEERDVEGAARFAHHELQEVAVLTELAVLQAEWAEMGIQVVTDNPSVNPDATDYSTRTIKNVERLDGYSGVGVEVADHITEDCHIIWVTSSQGRYGHTSWSHWCRDKRRHNKAGKSELKAPTSQHVGNTMSQDEKDSRRAARELKKLNEKRTAQWLSKLGTNRENYDYAVPLALNTWREDDARAAAMMLVTAGLIDPRPKGAEWGWHALNVNTYLEEKYDDENKRNVWRIRFLHARKVIEDRFPDDEVKALIESMEVIDEAKE